MVVVALVLNRFMGDKPWSIRSIPFKIVAVLLFISEVIKQVLSFKQGYSLYPYSAPRLLAFYFSFACYGFLYGEV